MRRLGVAIFTVLLFTMAANAARRTGELSNKEVKELLAKASTPQDHLRLAHHFAAKAKQYEAEAAQHSEMAKMYRAKPTISETKRPGAPDTAAHCEFLAGSLAKAAKEASALAGAHELMAK